jgi:hypothetical protein
MILDWKPVVIGIKMHEDRDAMEALVVDNTATTALSR